jgi:hypothetical protein
MLRRSPEVILVAHAMDPGRRELYVEGSRDRAFLNWLVGDNLAVRAAVVTIDLVEMPEVDEGGNRERLKRFLLQVESSDAEIRGLLDADHSVLIPEAVPSNVWLTDLRDAEGYVLAEENVDAALRLGCGIERVPASSIIASMQEVCKTLSAIRLASEQAGLRLPVSTVQLNRHVRVSSEGTPTLNQVALLRGLMQRAGISLREYEGIASLVTTAAEQVATFPVGQTLHGKDCFKVLDLQFRALGAPADVNVGAMLWSSFQRERLSDFPALSEVSRYLTKA